VYSFELNIGSLATPVIGGGWVVVEPVSSQTSINKTIEDDEIFARIKLSGSLMFQGDVFTALDTLRLTAAKCDLRIRHTPNGGTVSTIYEGEMGLRGIYKENICTLKVSPDDVYTELLTNKSKKVNILNSTPSVKCDVMPSESRLVFYYSNVAQSTLWKAWITDWDTYAREEKTYVNWVANLLDGTNGWAIISTNPDSTKTLGRSWQDGGFDAVQTSDMIFNIASPPVVPISLNTQIIVDGIACTVVVQYPIIGGGGQEMEVYLKNEIYYNASPITFSRFRKLRNVIELIINEFDSTIQFDDDTWTYLDANDDLKHLLIANVSDLIPVGGIEKTDAQEYGDMTFDKLMDMLRKKTKLYWKLQTISSVVYFRMKHRSEINYAAGSLDLQDFHSADWTRDIWKYLDIDQFNRLERTVVADNIDFLGSDILIPSLDNIAEVKVEGDEKWYFDVWDVIARGGDVYPTKTKNEFCMIAAEPIETDGVELLTTMTNTDYEVFSYSSYTLIAQNTSGAALAQSNSITPVSGYTYRIVLNMTASTGEKPEAGTIGGDLDFTRLTDGENILYATETGIGSLTLVIRNAAIASFTIEDMSIERWVYNCRIREGSLTGEQIANAELSVANLDAGHGQYELPDTPATINTVVTNLTDAQLLKTKEQVIAAPVHTPDGIDAEELFTTNKGDLEFKSIKIPLSGAMPEITGRFL
jgi:hypothetical protein